MKQLLSILLLFTLFSCEDPPEDKKPAQEPTEQESLSESYGKRAIALWATWYNMPSFKTIEDGIPLRDKKGNILGLKISHSDFCSLAMEGSGYVDGHTLNYAGGSSKNFVKGCRYKPSGRAKFYITDHPYAVGNRDNPLKPFVSVACDQSKYKFGQRFFIPEAKGTNLPNGSIHNGWFICEDVGGLIKGNHIDVFIGPYKVNPFPFIRSRKMSTFKAYLG